MKKEEIKEFLSETKVYVNGKSKEIQEKLFSLGCGWTGEDDIHEITYTSKPFLYIDDRLKLAFGVDMIIFTKHEYREITAEEILALEPTEQYRPFNTKEECWNEMMKHQPFGWVKKKGLNNHCNIVGMTEYLDRTKVAIDNYIYTLYQLFDNFIFVDDVPFGIKEK